MTEPLQTIIAAIEQLGLDPDAVRSSAYGMGHRDGWNAALSEAGAAVREIARSLQQTSVQEQSLDARDAKRLEAENRDLRQWLCDVLAGLKNGSGASPVCSLEFLSHIPEEVRLEVAGLRQQIAALQPQEGGNT